MRHVRVVLLVLVCACGGDNGPGSDASTDTTVPDDGSTNDVSPGKDASSTDAAADAPFDATVDAALDGGTDALADADATIDGSDAGPNITSWICGMTTVADCSLCSGKPQPCVLCAVADASVLEGVCVAQGTGCFTVENTTYRECRCGDAGRCPEGFEVCESLNGVLTCLTCGEGLTNGHTCQNGGTCDSADGGCL